MDMGWSERSRRDAVVRVGVAHDRTRRVRQGASGRIEGACVAPHFAASSGRRAVDVVGHAEPGNGVQRAG